MIHKTFKPSNLQTSNHNLSLFLRHHQIGLNKPTQFAIHYRLHVAHLMICTVVFDHLVGMEYIRADLGAPFDLAFVGVGCIF
jgi:hypothetical protein